MPNALLFSLLNSTVFLNNGTVTSNDTYIYKTIDCLYLEPENVSMVQNVWGAGPTCQYMYKINGTAPPPISCEQIPTEAGYDRPGGDYAATSNYTSTAACQTACCNAAQCLAFVWISMSPGDFLDCKQGQPCCFLKSTVSQFVVSPYPGIVAGQKDPYYNISVVVPPSGMRSAVPLGGIGAGSFELRADGTIHEWTVHNAGPASSAKLGVIEDMMLGVRVADNQSGKYVAKILRTGSLGSSSSSLYADGVDAMTYSGSYPVSKLTIHESSFAAVSDLAVYAYSRFVPGNLNASATPAVTFTLTVSNPSTTNSLNVSLFLSLPLPAFNDCYGTTSGPSNRTQTANAAACLHMCAASSSCNMWTWEADTQSCTMMNGVPLIAYRAGFTCGVSGAWQTDSNNNFVLNQMPSTCLSSNPSPLCGSYSLSTINSTASVSFAAGDSLADLWSAFYKQGSFTGVDQESNAAYGVASATITLAPGQSASSSLVFSWYLPYRDYLGKTLGSFYANLYGSVSDVANEFSTLAIQEQMISDINDHHSVWASPNRSEPDWLADVAINSFSHMRNAMFFKDGRWRQYEAFDCDDVDSVHNDFQRHLPYLWAFPEVEVQKSKTWASFASGGMIQEALATGCSGPPGNLDEAGGRAMSDVTSIWAIGVLELYQTGGMSLGEVNALWPSVVKGLDWQLSQCKNPAAPNLPAYLVSTYDIEVLEKYPTTTYNSFIHLAMMKAVATLAKVVGDAVTLNEAETAFEAGLVAVRSQLWNPETQSFRAYAGFNATMSDSLYGISIAHSLGLGILWNSSAELLSHLQYEAKTNLDDFGLKVLVGREEPAPILGLDTSHWGMAGPTFSYVSLAAGSKDIDGALNPTRLFMDNYRSRVNDQWNLAGLTTSANWTFREHDNGQSWCTSHYGMPLTHYYAHYALSGLQINLPSGNVTINPVYPAPFVVPLLLAGTTGVVSKDRTGLIKVTINFGSLNIPAGGLVVSGKPYPKTVQLTKGQSISWS